MVAECFHWIFGINIYCRIIKTPIWLNTMNRWMKMLVQMSVNRKWSNDSTHIDLEITILSFAFQLMFWCFVLFLYLLYVYLGSFFRSLLYAYFTYYVFCSFVCPSIFLFNCHCVCVSSSDYLPICLIDNYTFPISLSMCPHISLGILFHWVIILETVEMWEIPSVNWRWNGSHLWIHWKETEIWVKWLPILITFDPKSQKKLVRIKAKIE